MKFRNLTKPSKERFRQGLQTLLKTACPKNPRLISGKNHKSAFRGMGHAGGRSRARSV